MKLMKKNKIIEPLTYYKASSSEKLAVLYLEWE